MVAVGTFDPGIEIWDLDVVDAVDPLLSLGGVDRAAAAAAAAGAEPSISGKVKKKKKGKVCLCTRRRACPTASYLQGHATLQPAGVA